jgi:hypothetical protein
VIDAGLTHKVPCVSEDLVFAPIWQIVRRPRPNLNPSKFLNVGELTVTPREVSFRSDKSSASSSMPIPNDPPTGIVISRIANVGLRRYGWGPFPRFIEIEFEVDGAQRAAFFTDGGWMGWRPILTRSNGGIAHSIRVHLGLGSG